MDRGEVSGPCFRYGPVTWVCLIWRWSAIQSVTVTRRNAGQDSCDWTDVLILVLYCTWIRIHEYLSNVTTLSKQKAPYKIPQCHHQNWCLLQDPSTPALLLGASLLGIADSSGCMINLITSKYNSNSACSIYRSSNITGQHPCIWCVPLLKRLGSTLLNSSKVWGPYPFHQMLPSHRQGSNPRRTPYHVQTCHAYLWTFMFAYEPQSDRRNKIPHLRGLVGPVSACASGYPKPEIQWNRYSQDEEICHLQS
jgi:hypothetical protein